MNVTKYEADRIIREWERNIRDMYWVEEKARELHILIELAKKAEPTIIGCGPDRAAYFGKTTADIGFKIDV